MIQKQSLNQIKQPHEDLITSFKCLYVHSVANHGILKLFSNHLIFTFAGGKDVLTTDTKYSDIEDVIVSDHCAHAMNNLEIKTIQNNSLLFSGIQNPQQAKELILLIKKQLSELTNTFGLTPEPENSSTVKFKPLENPKQVNNIILPASFSTVTSCVMGKEVIQEVYASFGNEDIVIGDWIPCDGYQERRIDYKKLVILPVLGKNLIQVAEFQKLFELDGKICIHVDSDLGKTPYCDCFDPKVQMFFSDKGGTTEFVVNFEMIWSSEPFVKSIIDNKTTAEITTTYKEVGKAYSKAVGGKTTEETDKKEETPENSEEKFKITKIIYMVFIWILIITIFIISLYRYKNSKDNKYTFGVTQQLSCFSLLFFVILLIYF